MENFYSQNSKALADFILDKALPYLESVKAEQGNDAMVEHAYVTIDEILEKGGLWEKATCKKGCYFCCHDQIKVTRFEADYIKRRIKEEGVKPNRILLKKQQRVQDFKSLKWKDQACSMLDQDGTCKIYPIRPIVCRTHNSLGPAELCHKGNNPGSTVPEGRSIEAEGLNMALIKLDNIESFEDMKSLHEIL